LNEFHVCLLIWYLNIAGLSDGHKGFSKVLSSKVTHHGFCLLNNNVLNKLLLNGAYAYPTCAANDGLSRKSKNQALAKQSMKMHYRFLRVGR